MQPRQDERARVVLNVGNVLELAGAALLCWAVYLVAGLAGFLAASGVVLVLLAELVYDAATARVPLPHVRRLAARLRRNANRKGYTR